MKETEPIEVGKTEPVITLSWELQWGMGITWLEMLYCHSVLLYLRLVFFKSH
jgi:hypothetical protein